MKSLFRQLIPFLIVALTGCTHETVNFRLSVTGIKQPVISLNGSWKIITKPPECFWDTSLNTAWWAGIQVPGECQMQGFPVKHDLPFVYRQVFPVPEDFAGNQIFLHFHGVYSHARVWVNGQFIRDHTGGFTKWECNITDVVTPGDSAILFVEVTDCTDEISYGSGYAKHQIGGILRKVELVALPEQHFKSLLFETDLDEKYENADLKIFYETTRETASKVKIELFDNHNRRVGSLVKNLETSKGQLVLPVKNPEKWDAEHPHLYTVMVTLFEKGKETLKTAGKIGFREILVKGNQLLVNGQPVKLRGACRHDIHPQLGRMTTPELDLQDVLLAKEANFNFIRTSHYPPSETFLDYCDQYGIYVEDETAVCFVGSHRMNAYRSSGATQNDSLFTPVYLNQLEEMVSAHRNHPSVIIWSIGNENVFGSNFVKSYRWVKEHDTTRPVIYSYPGQVPDSLRIYDIISMHYPDWKGNLTQYGLRINGFSHENMPVLFDEWAHVACYNNEELKSDPNVRNFWGQSLDSMWMKVFEADGGLGGAIWGMIDETFMLPPELPGFNQWWGIIDPNIIPSTYVGPCVGYGEWGIVDTWRRKKPEFFLTKKAYSPAKIYLNNIKDYQSGKELKIPVHNRFDHTNFNELKIVWKYGDHSGTLKKPDLKPHARGMLTIPAQLWSPGNRLDLAFYSNDTCLVDNYSLLLGKAPVHLPEPEPGISLAEETNDYLRFSGGQTDVLISKKTGLIENINVYGQTIIRSGPRINLKIPWRGPDGVKRIQDFAVNWKKTDFSYEMTGGIAILRTLGSYDSIRASFQTKIGGNGIIRVGFQAEGIPESRPLQEFGLIFITGEEFDHLAWKREAYFTGYPEGHPGNPEGKAGLMDGSAVAYREKPEYTWEEDVQDFYYHGPDQLLPYSNIVRSMKENILTYNLLNASGTGISVLSDGNQSARFDQINLENTLIIDQEWDYPELGWGNYVKNLRTRPVMSGKVVLQVWRPE